MSGTVLAIGVRKRVYAHAAQEETMEATAAI